MHVVVRAHDVAENRAAGDHLFTVADGGDDVEVLEDPVSFRANGDRRVVDVVDLPRDDGIDGRAVGGCDVDAVVEEERARPLQAVREHRVQEARARIAEVRPDRMLLVERLDRPGESRGAGARGERQGEAGDEQEESEAHGS